jgi:hypothetical protein
VQPQHDPNRPGREIREVALLDLTGAQAASALDGITRISEVATILVPESLLPKLSSIPMDQVAATVPVPDGARAKSLTGEITLSGEALANPGGKANDVLIVVGKLILTSPVQEVGYADIIVIGEVFAPTGSETALGVGLRRMTGKITYYPYTEGACCSCCASFATARSRQAMNPSKTCRIGIQPAQAGTIGNRASMRCTAATAKHCTRIFWARLAIGSWRWTSSRTRSFASGGASRPSTECRKSDNAHGSIRSPAISLSTSTAGKLRTARLAKASLAKLRCETRRHRLLTQSWPGANDARPWIWQSSGCQTICGQCWSSSSWANARAARSVSCLADRLVRCATSWRRRGVASRPTSDWWRV